ncbi:RNA recognition domain-containing protein [Sarocladium strictum]
MSASTVNVSNISGSTTDGEIRDFFSFCGKIADIKVTTEGETKKAEVTFEKETAKKTALLLNNTQLGSQHISVTSATGDNDDDGSHFSKERDSDEITQEEKPRARILAEYLAHGYVIGDATLQRAIELDSKHGVSSRFLNTLQGFDNKLHATDRAKATDQTYGITERANSLLTGLSSYFEKAANTPTGQKIVQFYSDSSKQVQDIHAEARRLANLKTEEADGSAVKAAGLEKVFGKDKPADSAGAAATTSTDGPAVGVMNPTNPSPNEPIAPVVPAEKTS